MGKKRTSKKKSAPKSSRKTGRNTVVRIVIFLFLGIITAGSVFLLKNPEIVTGLSRKESISKAKQGTVPPPSPAKKTRDVWVNLYFSDPYSDFLAKEARLITWETDNVKGQVRMIVEELLKGPQGNLVQTMPPRVVIRDITLKGKGLGVIDLSRELSQNHPGGSLAEMHTIYSIVNSLLLNIPSLEAIQILVEGKVPETLKGHIDCRNPFKANLSIIKSG